MTPEFEHSFQTGVVWAKYHPDKLKEAGETIRRMKGQGMSDAAAIYELLSECLATISTHGGPGPGKISLEERNT